MNPAKKNATADRASGRCCPRSGYQMIHAAIHSTVHAQVNQRNSPHLGLRYASDHPTTARAPRYPIRISDSSRPLRKIAGARYAPSIAITATLIALIRSDRQIPTAPSTHTPTIANGGGREEGGGGGGGDGGDARSAAADHGAGDATTSTGPVLAVFSPCTTHSSVSTRASTPANRAARSSSRPRIISDMSRSIC